MRSHWRILAMLSLWTAACWLVIGGLLHRLLPGGWLAVPAAAFLCLVPSLGMIRGFRRAAYPSALKRLWVVRPFWYTQLFLPLLAVSGLLGIVAGLPFGASGTAGRWALGIGAAAVAGLAVLGYLGARRLVV